jgi:polyhydroxyalkanoate synthesis regulator phasin
MDTKRFDEKNLAKHKERCDMIEQLAIAEEENRKLGIRADKLEQRLESETRKAERRMRHIDLMGAALTERRSQLHERGERIAELEKQVADLRAKLANAEVPTERERAILDMWPRFEDGEPVMIGDEVNGLGGEIVEVYITENETAIWNSSANHMHLSPGERVKRPASKVLDADGVEIKVGDTVYGIGRNQHLYEIIDPHHIDPEVGEAFSVRCYDRDESEECHCRPELLTHTLPDSWEQLEEDAGEDPFRYCKTVGKRLDTFDNAEVFKSADIVRRAKALAGAEVGE